MRQVADAGAQGARMTVDVRMHPLGPAHARAQMQACAHSGIYTCARARALGPGVLYVHVYSVRMHMRVDMCVDMRRHTAMFDAGAQTCA